MIMKLKEEHCLIVEQINMDKSKYLTMGNLKSLDVANGEDVYILITYTGCSF